jgi:hypothetical protein
MFRAAPALLFVVVLFAGCSQPDEQKSEPCNLEPVLCDKDSYLASHHCIVQDVRPRVYAPDTKGPDGGPNPWKRGDWWEYGLKVGGVDKGRTKLVYYEDQDFVNGVAQHYMVGTPTRQEALDHAMFSTNPVIGRIHRELYSPHEKGVHADMFAFPLCTGSSWQTTFFAEKFTLTATHAKVALPGGQSDPLGFTIAGTGAAGSSLSIHYSPLAKWFTRIDLDRPQGEDVILVLTGMGSAYRGDVFFLRGQAEERYDLSKQGAETIITRQEGKEGPYDTLGVHLQLSRAGSGKIEAHLRNPQGTSVACVGLAGGEPGGTTTCPAGPLVVEVPWAAGSWKLTVEKGLLSDAKAQGEARIVSIYDRSGRV